MAIDLLNIKPTTISRDLRDKFILLYGLESGLQFSNKLY